MEIEVYSDLKRIYLILEKYQIEFGFSWNFLKIYYLIT